MPGGHCECDETDITEVNNGMALMVHTQAEDSSSDNDKLPVYACTICNNAIVLGRGGTLWCTTCRSKHVFKIGDNVALLRLRAKGFNHQQGVIICTHNDQCSVLLVGASEPIAVRPINMRTISGTPVHRKRPQEQEVGSPYVPVRLLHTLPTTSPQPHHAASQRCPPRVATGKTGATQPISRVVRRPPIAERRGSIVPGLHRVPCPFAIFSAWIQMAPRTC